VPLGSVVRAERLSDDHRHRHAALVSFSPHDAIERLVEDEVDVAPVGIRHVCYFTRLASDVGYDRIVDQNKFSNDSTLFSFCTMFFSTRDT